MNASKVQEDKVDIYLESASPIILKRRASIKKDPSYRKDFTSLEFTLNVAGVDLKSETTLGSDKLSESVSDSDNDGCGNPVRSETPGGSKFLQVPSMSRTQSIKSKKNAKEDDDIRVAESPERRAFVK